ncbi:PQQ-dependent sugar dehydrogenase [Cellulomonas humilata]|uniref:PQQ-dependent sugar dehydrogenase n=1 Tax=Cellulomonas humilata TaxID=144055 RepID=A0A7Y6A1R9_9CELL|nr:PQQ-dependent sugar dehydrogenase [Cellulomonas humilata]NUU16894.1 PQQ-dependent sugar dehydrogenase [Cellulomonas humilata]
MTVRRTAWVGLAVAVSALAGCTSPAESSDPTTGPSRTAAASPSSSAPATGQVSGVDDIIGDLAVPWGIAFLPDGQAVITLRDAAQLVLVGPDGAATDVTGPGADELADVVVPSGEGGLLGVAVLGSSGGAVDLALYATAADDNRVLRGTLDGSTLGELRPIVTGIAKAGNHDGGRLAVGPDGYLYVTTGDAGDPPSAQDPDSLNGKILRLTSDGDPAPGNPDEDSPVWSLGHRNVQGIGWAPDGRMFASEFGQNTWDELNLIEPGGNYGWPEVEGAGAVDGFVEPVAVWATDDASPSGLAVTADAVYLAGLRGERLWRVPLTDDGVGTPHALLDGERGRLRAVEPAPDGSLWVITGNTDGRGDPRPGDDRILRVVVD